MKINEYSINADIIKSLALNSDIDYNIIEKIYKKTKSFDKTILVLKMLANLKIPITTIIKEIL